MTQSPQLIHTLDKKTSGVPVIVALIVFLVALGFGGGTGFFAYKIFGGSNNSSGENTQTGGRMDASNDDNPNTAGVKDPKVFKDSAEGKVVAGGIEGEGSHHIERPGGASQYIYITSSTIDLTKFEGKKVKVLGKTFAGEKAGWLMDVGYIEIQ